MNRAGQVLVVEDDETSRRFLQFALAKQGYEVRTAEDAGGAREQLAAGRLQEIDCVVSDVYMPGSSGLKLLCWIQGQDPSLATIMITAEGEKQIVTQSLRDGAFDYLDKPIDPEKLFSAVARGVEHTRRHRHMVQSESAAREVGCAQQQMLHAAGLGDPVAVEVCFHPKCEAGGDFLCRFHPAPSQFFYLLTDVSGHDLRAAYISAYFHGVVRGMLELAAPAEKILVSFNRLLMEEWSRFGNGGGSQPGGVEASVASCAILIQLWPPERRPP